MPPLAFRTVAKVAAAESNRSINAYEGLRPLPDNVKAPIELPADAKVICPPAGHPIALIIPKF